MHPLFQKTRQFFSGYYTLLLISLFLLFILRPYERGALYLATWKVFLTLALVFAIFNCKHVRSIRTLAIYLSIPSFLFTWINLFDRNEILRIAALVEIEAGLVAAFEVHLELETMLAHDDVETLRGVICAYFLIAFAFAYIYYLVEYTVPGTLHFATNAVSIHSSNHFLSEMLYFSFVTLLAIGYGDITVIGDIGQTFAVLEGIIGQFYVAILVARIVSVYAFYSDKRLLKHFEKELKK